ncbi:branched-chain amino acid ABC transporter permease [Deferribacterales bacterium Es71-Z0220]|jgi:branched-chain amino acid transport system permease protein|uniref:branched-chain amino acid ABC transporter permease n=1 Tax=Deferrivibrio essentukiensis TaxID=2880922 RepID=UPI001F61DFBD|nr:branched-chain amino acid ABC transporter permease [Deferrivibrio essentukiensis]MBZ4672847.1 amino acid/amide transporter rane protein 1, family [Deferribacteraceae bacterium]MCB4204087.1 branched-chain amino acid ABC transporter permease [Deferrivibrio essentukiensis]
MEFFLQLIVAGIVMGSIYAIVALGFTLIYKSTGVVNFAQGELLLVGAYICLHLTVEYRLNFVASFIITILFMFFFGFFIEKIFLRKMIGEPIISIIMLTIGLSSVLKSVVQLIWGTNTKTFPQIFPEEPLIIGEISISYVYIFSIISVSIFLALFTIFFKKSKVGIAMRAVASDQQAALSMGIDVKRIFALSWAIAAVVSSVGGILIGNINGINTSLSQFGLKVFPVVILGGLDSILGAIVGGLIIGILENLAGGYIDPLIGGGAKEVFPFIFMIIILMIKPYGLFGTVEVEKV